MGKKKRIAFVAMPLDCFTRSHSSLLVRGLVFWVHELLIGLERVSVPHPETLWYVKALTKTIWGRHLVFTKRWIWLVQPLVFSLVSFCLKIWIKPLHTKSCSQSHHRLCWTVHVHFPKRKAHSQHRSNRNRLTKHEKTDGQLKLYLLLLFVYTRKFIKCVSSAAAKSVGFDDKNVILLYFVFT